MIRRLPLLSVTGVLLAVALIGFTALFAPTNTAVPPTGPATSTRPDESYAAQGPSPIATRTPAIPSPGPSAPGASSVPSPSPIPPSSIPRGVVPILYYHRVQAAPAEFRTWSRAHQRAFLRYDTLPAAFEAQLDWLVMHGYSTILPRALAANWDLGSALPAKPVILSFDDGYPSWVTTVLPMLRQRGMVAEFYLTLTAITPHVLRWSDVQRLADAGNGIGAHDVHHVQLAGLPARRSAPPDVMWTEVSAIRSIITAHVGTPPDSMAYVGGGFDATLLRLVEQAGYTTARSILRGIVQSPSHRFTLRIVRVGSRDDVIDPFTQTLVDGLPTFSARMRGVSDISR